LAQLFLPTNRAFILIWLSSLLFECCEKSVLLQ
jgi:hypothetical protein